MKIYDFSLAPNPRRVRIFAAEKGLKIPSEQVDLLAGKSRSPEYLAKNPAGGLPLLELDDGTYLAESVAICRYLEGLHPEPNLMGRDFREQATIEMWNRRMELNLFGPATRAFQNTSPLFAARMKQYKDFGEAQQQVAAQQLAWIDGQLKGREFIAADRFTIADITALVALEFGRDMGGVKVDPGLKNLARWHAGVSSRPSAKA
jgi:glutathione S-transferase